MLNYFSYLEYLKLPFSAEVFIYYKLTLLLFVIIIAVSYLIDFYSSHSIFGPKYRYFLAPGVIVHELAHGFACFFTGAKVTQLSVFEKEGGHVRHTKSKIPILGTAFISTAPLIAGIVIIYFISKYLNTADFEVFKYGYSVKSLILSNITIAKNLSHYSIKNWLLLYLTISVAVTMLPSKQDIFNAFFPLLVLLILFLLISKYLHLFIPIEQINALLFNTINLLIIAAILSIIVFALSNIFRR